MPNGTLIVALEAVLIFGGVVAFAIWQLHSIKVDQAKAAKTRKAEQAQENEVAREAKDTKEAKGTKEAKDTREAREAKHSESKESDAPHA